MSLRFETLESHALKLPKKNIASPWPSRNSRSSRSSGSSEKEVGKDRAEGEERYYPCLLSMAGSYAHNSVENTYFDAGDDPKRILFDHEAQGLCSGFRHGFGGWS